MCFDMKKLLCKHRCHQSSQVKQSGCSLLLCTLAKAHHQQLCLQCWLPRITLAQYYLLPSLLQTAVTHGVQIPLDLLQYALVENTGRAVVPQQGVFSGQLQVLADFTTHSIVADKSQGSNHKMSCKSKPLTLLLTLQTFWS